jgi:predicted Rossmann fold nucleotide-binding protein DprA/Smf involved in DNA uptake
MGFNTLSADTEVVLLLCGRFGGERQEPFQPLSGRDYGELAKWLNARGLRPADLMTDVGRAQLQEVHQVKLERKRLESLLERGTAMALALERWNRGGLWVISRGDAEFPKRLKHHLKHAAPPLLYGAGKKELLDMGGLAIVGSRDATEAAIEFTRNVAAQCVREGLGVVSGGARGVDSAAMQGATDAGGYSIGVLANDLLKASVNRQNRMGLQEGRLVLVSPFYPEAGFNGGNAMGRNKYIYALSDRALVIDSALGSGGTWEGALEALKQKWVPLYVRTPGHGQGNAALIEKGAIPFTYVPGRGELLSDVFDSEPNSHAVVEPSVVQPSLLSTFEEAGKPGPTQVVAGGAVEQQSTDSSTSKAPVVSEAVPGVTNSAEVTVHAVTATGTSSLDMYDDFLAKLAHALPAVPLTEEQIATSLGLEKAQAKVWLKRALEDGHLEKLKNPVRYSLRLQSLLLG